MTAAARDPLARVRRRPSAADWADDDTMTLAEAIEVFWPDGPLTVASLRTEIRKGRLTRSQVAGKDFVTPAGLRAMFKAAECPATPKAHASISGEAGLINDPAKPSQTSISSEMERLRSARAAALVACQKLKGGSQPTSSENRRRSRQTQTRQPPSAAKVIQLASVSPKS